MRGARAEPLDPLRILVRGHPWRAMGCTVAALAVAAACSAVGVLIAIATTDWFRADALGILGRGLVWLLPFLLAVVGYVDSAPILRRALFAADLKRLDGHWPCTQCLYPLDPRRGAEVVCPECGEKNELRSSTRT